MVSAKKYDQKYFFKLLLLYKVRKTDFEKNKLSLEIMSFLFDIIKKSKRKIFEKLKNYKKNVFENDCDSFYEDRDIENESYICLKKCLNNFKIFKEVQQAGTFLGYYKISLERHLSRQLLEKVFSLKEDQITYNLSVSKMCNSSNFFENYTELEIKIIFNQNLKIKNIKDFCIKNSITIEQYDLSLERIRKIYFEEI